ncbi:hypothetical protein HMPREF1624_04316 [Sporothrix schenckii ATCC 58251]|uniref:Aminoglycoside phosphotransferase domain-containing protein n=1 Tax=Sporothrix schenckii (strain ATCC 58251 / de Perez 2211183) TaxID=1391915 RepID=U7PXC9_SPOS1|nr:hypothetical protein HMPREF1624_04316 [Sporothrix schenckii ATCC 58251]
MKFVAEHTSIPVPEVHNVYRDAKSSHARIVMEYIDGDRLDSVWVTSPPNKRMRFCPSPVATSQSFDR